MKVKYIKPREVCEMLSIERPYLYRLINERQFPVIKIGSRTYRYDEDEVMKWIEKQKQGQWS